jgi:outer membrane protein, heavy metal efflux system
VSQLIGSWCSRGITLILAVSTALPAQSRTPLSLAQARDSAARSSSTLLAAREAVNAARARERQSAAYPNPTISLGREQTSGSGQGNSQNTASLDQVIELGGVRGARRDVFRARREAAEARLDQARLELEYEVARAYALAVAGDRQVAIAERAAASFAEAQRVSQQRLTAGDVAGYAHRRLGLEVARHATARAEAVLAARAARSALATLLNRTDAGLTGIQLTDTMSFPTPAPARDSLVAIALRARGELRALSLEAEVAQAEARLAAAERTPVPTVSAGFKNERQEVSGVTHALSGFVAGVSVPLPIFDRRGGAVEAAQADTRRRFAELESARRRIVREVNEAHDAYRVAQEQVGLLAPSLGEDARAALRAAQVAYAEGEITQTEWLDVIRAYREAETSLATLQGELSIRRAALERAVGTTLSDTSRGGSGRPSQN